VPWHVLPRRAASTEARWLDKRGDNLAIFLHNNGRETGQYDLYSLMATSPRLPTSALPNPGDNFAAVDLKAVGVRYLADTVCGEAGGCVEFAISTYGRRAHPGYPGGFEVDIDTDGDGVPDYAVYNDENGGFSATGQVLIWVQKLGAAERSAYFYADADLNSGNMIMTIPLEALGIAAGTTIGFDVFALDNYFSGSLSDELLGMRFTPGAARFNAVGAPYGEVPARSGGRIGVKRSAVPETGTTERGVLLMHRRNTRNESDVLLAN
jgi:hypothetical protein